MSDQNLTDWRKLALKLEAEINKVILGQELPIRLVTNAIFSRGHVLLEGDVGVGKTTLLKAFARAIGGGYERIEGDPVMPGCLGLDAMWQLLGFYLGWKGGLGKGRALGAGEVKFSGQVLPSSKKITYIIDLKRVIMRKLVMGIADASMKVDGRLIYQANDLKVGLFVKTDIF